MIIIRPVEITDAILTSSDVPENDESEWLVGTSYSIDEVVMRTVSGTHSVYISIANGNIGNTPESDDPISPQYWARTSATNRWAMFSDQINDQTEQAESIEVELTPGALVNSMALFNLDAESVTVVMDDPIDGEVYNETINLVDASGVNNWYSYYFEPITRQSDLAILDLPPFISASITVTINDSGDIAKCGLLTIGSLQELGDTDYGTGIGIIDYSTKERDTFGNPVIQQRNFSKRSNYNVTVDTNSVGAVQNTLSMLRTTPLTWIGDVDFPSTIIYGYYRDFDVVLSNPTKSLLTIEVEGLT